MCMCLCVCASVCVLSQALPGCGVNGKDTVFGAVKASRLFFKPPVTDFRAGHGYGLDWTAAIENRENRVTRLIVHMLILQHILCLTFLCKDFLRPAFQICNSAAL